MSSEPSDEVRITRIVATSLLLGVLAIAAAILGYQCHRNYTALRMAEQGYEQSPTPGTTDLIWVKVRK